jgi:hypothetical protein
MGCSEGKLVGLMKRRGHIEQLTGIDIDAQLLRGQENAIQPLTTDFLLPRERPLQITLMQGMFIMVDAIIIVMSLKITFVSTCRFYCQPRPKDCQLRSINMY